MRERSDRNDPRGKDARVARTRRALAGALVALTLERGFEAVSVRELTARAGVGYATFFRHYRSKEALLKELLAGTLAELKARLHPLSAAGRTREQGTLLFAHAAAHADLYRVLLRSAELEDAVQAGVESVLEAFEERPGSAVPPEVAAHHLVRACVALITWWLERDMPYPPERMGEMFEQLIVGPTVAAALQLRRP